MARALKLLGIFLSVAIASLLWAWLLFGGRRVVCGDLVRPMFVAGSMQFMVLAGIWGAWAVSLVLSKQAGLLHHLLWAFGLGSLFHVLHCFFSNWLVGINFALTALIAILITQSVILPYLYSLSLMPRDFQRAVLGWGALGAAGLLGVLATELWLATIPCQLTPEYMSLVERVLSNSLTWYIVCGLFPSLITALLYVGETQPSR